MHTICTPLINYSILHVFSHFFIIICTCVVVMWVLLVYWLCVLLPIVTALMSCSFCHNDLYGLHSTWEQLWCTCCRCPQGGGTPCSFWRRCLGNAPAESVSTSWSSRCCWHQRRSSREKVSPSLHCVCVCVCGDKLSAGWKNFTLKHTHRWMLFSTVEATVSSGLCTGGAEDLNVNKCSL